MIFRKYDESFALQAADTTLRPGLIRALSSQRTLTGAMMIVSLVISMLSSDRSTFAPFTVVFLVITMQADGQIKILKALEKLSSNTSPTSALAGDRLGR